MERIFLYLILILGILLPRQASCQKNDTLLVASGDIVIGELLSLDEGELVFDTEHLGKLKVERQNILWLKTTKKVTITTTSSIVLIGTYSIVEKKMAFYTEDGDTLTFMKNQIAEMYPLGKNFWNSAHGNIGAGYNYTRSNRLSQGNFTVNMKYLKDHIYYSLSSTYIRSQSPSQSLEENFNASISRDHIYDNGNFAGIQYAPQRNTALQLRWRNTVGAHFGRRQVLSPFAFFTGSIGLSINNEFFNPTAENELPENLTSTELKTTLRFVFKRPANPKVRSEISGDYFRRLGDPRDRFNINATGSIKLYADLWFSITYFLNTDNKPEGGIGNDYGFINSLNYTF